MSYTRNRVHHHYHKNDRVTTTQRTYDSGYFSLLLSAKVKERPAVQSLIVPVAWMQYLFHLLEATS